MRGGPGERVDEGRVAKAREREKCKLARLDNNKLKKEQRALF